MNPRPSSPPAELLPPEPWAAFAQNWALLGSPLRPRPEDVRRAYSAWLRSLPQGLPDRPIDILSLGVTPEYATHLWAPEYDLTAIDSSEDMLIHVWPGDTTQRRAVLGDWRALPVPDASVDLILNDGGLCLLSAPNAVPDLVRELRRVLRPDGRVVMRQFTRTTLPELPEALVLAAECGELRNFHAFKLRLLMALQGDSPERGVRLDTAWQVFERLCPDRARLAELMHCTREVIDTIDAYRGSPTLYCFRTMGEIAAAFRGFHLDLALPGRYELADRCPVFCLSPQR